MSDVVFLLVHGSWHGAWCWERLIPEIERRGAAARTVALPSVGDDPAALGGLPEDAAAVAAAAAGAPGDVVVVAHSYGGAAVAEARLGPGVRRLVFLGAFMPDAGRPYVSYLPPGPLPAYVGMRDDGTMVVPPGQARAAFYADCDDATVAWAEARLRPQSVAVAAHVPGRPSWRGLPSTYVVLADDAAIPPDLQRSFAAQADAVRELPGSHSPMLARPAALAALLVEEAGRT
jgi:hypothetical protein